MNNFTREVNIMKGLELYRRKKTDFCPIYSYLENERVLVSLNGETIHLFELEEFYFSLRHFLLNSKLPQMMKHSESAPPLHFCRFFMYKEKELIFLIGRGNRPVYIESKHLKEFGTFDRLKFHGYGCGSPVYVYNKKDELLGFIMPYRM